MALEKVTYVREITTLEGNTWVYCDTDPERCSKDIPQLWAFSISMACIGDKCEINNVIRYGTSQPKWIIYAERATLERHGLLPIVEIKGEPLPEKPKTVEDLLHEIIDLLGVVRNE
jgi:hypothetical protein